MAHKWLYLLSSIFSFKTSSLHLDSVLSRMLQIDFAKKVPRKNRPLSHSRDSAARRRRVFLPIRLQVNRTWRATRAINPRSVCHIDCTSASVIGATAVRYYKIGPTKKTVIFIAGFRSIRGWHGVRRDRPPPSSRLSMLSKSMFPPSTLLLTPVRLSLWRGARIYTLFAPFFRFGTTLANRLERPLFSFLCDTGGGVKRD